MKLRLTKATDFLRIFRLPTEFPTEYCFGGGHPVEFQLIDWFNVAGGPLDLGKEFSRGDPDYERYIKELSDYMREKKWFDPSYTYMVLTDFGDVFLINPEKRVLELEKEYALAREKAIIQFRKESEIKNEQL